MAVIMRETEKEEGERERRELTEAATGTFAHSECLFHRPLWQSKHRNPNHTKP